MPDFTDQYRQMVDRHENDLYHGNGKPGITNRLQVIEDDVSRSAEQVEFLDKKFWAIILLLLTILGTVIGELLRR